MIVITRRLAKRLKTTFRQALNLSRRNNATTIQLTASSDGLRIRYGNGQAAAEFRLDGEQPEQTVYMPFDMLSEIEGGRDIPIEIHSNGDKVTASWLNGNVPQFAERDAPSVLSQNWPPTPATFVKNPVDLLSALRDASQTTDAASTRYALGCVQFRGCQFAGKTGQ